MRSIILLATLTALTCCGDGPSRGFADRQLSEPDPFGRKLDPALAPVTDPQAKTVQNLFDAGLVIVGQREAGCDAGPGVACDGFSALYFGRDLGDDVESLAEFACPGIQAPTETWKCRPLDPPYKPNDGFAPEAKAK